MDSEGPKPMKNYKPTQKNLNSAEQFDLTHQAGYEEMGKPSQDRLNMVHQHNKAHPMLRDEMDRRRSVVLVKRSPPNKRKCQCKSCLKLNVKQKNKRKNLKRKYAKDSGIKKRTVHRQSRRQRNCKCIYVADKATGMDSNEIQAVLKNKKRNKENSVNSFNSLNTSIPSISTFHSVPSTNHEQEPMVAVDYS